MRMSPGTLIFGIFAVMFGLVGAYAAKQYLRVQPPAPAKAQRQIVPMASADLEPGRKLTLGDIMLVSMTPDDVRKRGLPSLFMTNASQIIGRTLREPLPKGDVFLTTHFYPEGIGPSVAERLQPGLRAVTVPLENNATELSVVSPGMMVDIVFRTSADVLKNVPETTVTLLERVEVLAIGQEMFKGANPLKAPNVKQATPAATVTLAVSPAQAGALKVAEGRGTMSLVVRGLDDEKVVGRAEPQTLTSLLHLPDPEPPFSTQIYRRGRLTTAVFENGKQAVVTQSFDTLPVAAARSEATVSTVSQTVAKGNAAKEKSCGCGDKQKTKN